MNPGDLINIVELTRRMQISSCHRLHSPHLSDEENKKIYGKCNHVNGHGHNYEIQVTVRGQLDEKTGMVMNIQDLNAAMKKSIMDTIDHKNLDKDVEFFKTAPSTTENLAIYIWQEMEKHLPNPKLLYKVMIKETENNFISYHGPNYY